MRTRMFTDNPRSTIEAVRMIQSYFSDGTRDKVVIHYKAIKRASRLLKLMTKTDEHGNLSWVRSSEWRSRLVLAGLDPDTLEIVDQERWDLAWEQMSRTRTFRDDIQRKNLALGKKAPKAEPFLRAKVLEPRFQKKPPVTPITDYLSPDLKRKLLGKSKKK
jgi:hypothetical protein